MNKTYQLLDAQGKPYQSAEKGSFGGHKKLKIYGKLNCPSALSYLAKGQYKNHRVFFLNEETAVSAGYRPCAKCMPKEYKVWKENSQPNRTGTPHQG